MNILKCKFKCWADVFNGRFQLFLFYEFNMRLNGVNENLKNILDVEISLLKVNPILYNEFLLMNEKMKFIVSQKH